MITLDAVESYFPATTVTVEERAVQLGRGDVQAHMHRTVHGLDRMHYDAGLDLYDLVLPPARRVLAGIMEAGKAGFVMVVDDDDFVSRRLTSFVAEYPGKNGWYVHNGYLWGDGGKLLYEYADFSKFCGTSHIIRTDLYELPASVEAADPAYIRKMFGSHIFIREYLTARGHPLEPLPFVGAVYRIGHAGAHSKSAGLLKQVFFKRELLKNPLKLVGRFFRLRLLGAAARHQFWGCP